MATAQLRHDAHTHVWHEPPHPERVPEGCAGDVTSLLQDMDAAGIARAAIITPRSMGWDDGYTLASAEAHPDRLVAIVRCDLDSPDAAATLAQAFASGARGLRIAADDGPLGRLLSEMASEVREVILGSGAPLMLHAYPDDFADLERILDALPGHPVLLDHLGRPDVAEGPDADHFTRVLSLATHHGLHLKTPDVPYFSTPTRLDTDLVPFIGAAVREFGPERVLWGSDWPLCTVGHRYDEGLPAVASALSGLAPDDQALVWHGNFDRLFG